jgi:hypothetical protein
MGVQKSKRVQLARDQRLFDRTSYDTSVKSLNNACDGHASSVLLPRSSVASIATSVSTINIISNRVQFFMQRIEVAAELGKLLRQLKNSNTALQVHVGPDSPLIPDILKI